MKMCRSPRADFQVSRIAFGTASLTFAGTVREINKMGNLGSFRMTLQTSLVVIAVVLFSFTAFAQFQDSETSPLLEEMAGTWDVEQQTWAGPNVEATELPAAVATRRLVSGTYLQEEMTLAPDASGDPFDRSSYLNYNGVSGYYEYFSVDSRAPQQMHYKASKGPIGVDGTIKLDGGIFTAAEWGELKNVMFRYRAEISPTEEGRQTFKLFLTPTRVNGLQEFLAFQYNYTKRR